MKVVFLINFSFLLISINGAPGPKTIATKGEIWPQPQIQTKSENYFVLRLNTFNIESDTECIFLDTAFLRYQDILNQHQHVITENVRKWSRNIEENSWLKDDDSLGYLDSLNVTLNGVCDDNEYPKKGMDESYTLSINSAAAHLTANTVWGILRGLESFSQSVYIASDLSSLRINQTSIYDYPRFPHRGLLIDTSRHFIPVEYLLKNLDAMAYNKLNVFHWHIVDDESFPYASSKFDSLINGAYAPSKIYSHAEITAVIEYAKLRGIRVIPEFDTPGHTSSWGVGYPELLTECYSGGSPSGVLGPIDPTKDSTYTFLNDLFTEVSEIFKDEYIHLGGDEVSFDCWGSNKNVTDFMQNHNINTYAALESYYMQKLINALNDIQSKTIVWEEVFSNGVTLPTDTIVHVWKEDWSTVLKRVAENGKEALLSACWYLGRVQSGGDWKKFYDCEPLVSFGDDDEAKKFVLGGEACMWSEVVNEHNIISRIWPRASATAERLWAVQGALYTSETEQRLEEHTCRMNYRGIGAQPPNGAGESSPGIKSFMAENNIATYENLESYYMTKVIDSVTKLNSKTLVWEEVFRNGVNLPIDTTVHVWLTPYTTTIRQVLASGREAILSACFYLDQLESGGDVKKFYECEPASYIDNATGLLGGEAAMWAEVVNEHNLLSRVWPRAAAVAEKLWSLQANTRSYSDEAARRLEEHTCRLNTRGINAQPPNGAGFCL